jgi:hypothetical protein
MAILMKTARIFGFCSGILITSAGSTAARLLYCKRLYYKFVNQCNAKLVILFLLYVADWFDVSQRIALKENIRDTLPAHP